MTEPGFFDELRRRRVIRVGALYVLTAFIALQVADLLIPALLLPDWTFRMLAVVALLGLPIVLVVVWASADSPAERPDQRAADATAQAPAGPSSPDVAAKSTPGPSSPRSIAVLPFVNMSADPENEFFSDGITEELLNVLTKLGRFRVPARTSCFAYKGKDIDVREIGRRLGVNTVLEGSVRKAGERVRITSQLIDVEDGYHLWSESYDREIKDIFAIQDEIALRIVEALDVRLTDREVDTIRKVPTQSVRAYEHYLKGRQFFYHFRRRSFAHAREFFARAIEVDPDYALAYAGVADCCSFLYMYWEHTDANLSEADSASRRALELDPELAEAHAARGLALSLSKSFAEAERELQRAIELDPTLFEAYYFYARACWAQGKLGDAAELFRAANRVRPEDYQSLILLSNVYHALGRPDDERAAAQHALPLIRRHVELYPDDVRARYMGAGALILTGDRATGAAWLEQALETDDPSVYYNVACGFMRLEQPERALDCLSRAVDSGFAHREWVENDPELAALKSDPRFVAILERMARQAQS